MPRSPALKVRQIVIVPLLAGTIGFGAVVGPVWYYHVTVGSSPDDQTGIMLNSHAPAFM